MRPLRTGRSADGPAHPYSATDASSVASPPLGRQYASFWKAGGVRGGIASPIPLDWERQAAEVKGPRS